MSECPKHPDWKFEGFTWRCPHCASSIPAKSKGRTYKGRPSTGRLDVSNGTAAAAQRKRIRERDGYCCRSCGIAVKAGEVDHITPLHKGGSNDDTNLQLLCHDCHTDKSNRDAGYKVKRRVGLDGIPEGWA